MAQLCGDFARAYQIRQVLKTMRREDSITLGRRLLNHALGEHSVNEIAPENISKVLSDLKIASMDDLLAAIGLGELMSIVIARRLLGNADELTEPSKSGGNKINCRSAAQKAFCSPLPTVVTPFLTITSSLTFHRDVA